MYAEKLGYELGKPVVEPHESGDCIELRMYKLTTAANLQSVFPNIEIALRIYLCLMVTKAKTHLEQPTFNDASRWFESPDTDELRVRCYVRWTGPPTF